MKKYILLFAALLVFIGFAGLTTYAQVESVQYNQNLTIGSRGTDVLTLQQMLYAKGLLSVNPTGYFGVLTKNALVTLQANVGILPASGYFGPLTRAYLNLSATVSTTTLPTTTQPGCQSGATYNGTTGVLCPKLPASPLDIPIVPTKPVPVITSITPSSGAVGTQITITGSGFLSASDTIQFSNIKTTVSSTDDNHLVYIIPNVYKVQCDNTAGCTNTSSGALPVPATLLLTVTNEGGTSNTASFTVSSSTPVICSSTANGPCTVIPPTPITQTTPKSAPIITSINPSSAAIGSLVVINGNGFTAANNTIHFNGESCGTITSSSDGVTLSYKIPPGYGACGPMNSQAPVVAGSSYTVSVSNSNGTSSTIGFIVGTQNTASIAK